MISPRSLRLALLASVLLPPCLFAPRLSAQQKPSTAQPAPASTPTSTPAPTAAPGAPSTAPTMTVDARLVNLPVVVRDKKGALIQNLTKDDFILQVDGKPQTIRYFDKDTNLPLTLGLLVDTSASQRYVLFEERTASSTFRVQMLTTPKVISFIMKAATETE